MVEDTNCKLATVTLYLGVVHASPALMGVVSSDRSLPYKHSPAASTVNTLRAPSPASAAPPSADSNLSANSTTCSIDTEILWEQRETEQVRRVSCLLTLAIGEWAVFSEEDQGGGAGG